MMALALLGVMGRARGQAVEQALDDARDLIEMKRLAADFAEVYVQSVERFLKERVRDFGLNNVERQETRNTKQ